VYAKTWGVGGWLGNGNGQRGGGAPFRIGFRFRFLFCGAPVVRGLCAVSCDVVLIDCRLIEGMKAGKM